MFGFRNGRNSFTFALVQTVGCSLPDEYFLNVIIRINALIHIANSELSAFVTVTSKRHRLLQVIGKGFYAASISIFRNIMHLVMFAIGAANIALIEAFAIWDKMDYFWLAFVIDMILCSLLMYGVAKWHYNRFNKKMMAEKKTTNC